MKQLVCEVESEGGRGGGLHLATTRQEFLVEAPNYTKCGQLFRHHRFLNRDNFKGCAGYIWVWVQYKSAFSDSLRRVAFLITGVAAAVGWRKVVVFP